MSGTKFVWTPPAYANRCVFAQNDRELVCASLAGMVRFAHDASGIGVLNDAPWLLAAAGAVVAVVLAINLASLSIDPRRDPR